MYQTKLLFLLVLNLIVLSSCSIKSSDIADPIDDLLRNYDSRFRPNFGKHAVNVKVSMYIAEMFDYSDEDNMVRINFYFRQSWVDARLSFENTTIPPYINNINLGSELVKKIWTPDTFCSSSHKLSFVSKDEANTFLMIYRNGTVFMSKRFTAKMECLGSNAWFPFDTKECHFHAESYSMNVKDIIYQWIDDKSVVVYKKNIPFHVNPTKSYTQNIALLTGVYSIIGLKITIERYYFNYILCLYLPIILTTLLAGRLLNNSGRDLSSASLVVSALLFVGELICSILIKLSLNDKLVGTVSALDVFLVINFLFIFFYELMHICPKHMTRTANQCSDTKVILDENACVNNQYTGFFKFGLTLIYSLFVVSYLFVCITIRYLMSF